MKKVLALGGSNSQKSINKSLAFYAASKLENTEVIQVDLNNFELPLYGIDHENEHGMPENATKLNNLIKSVDGLILSLAEHNGSYTAAFKNTYDWLSRINSKVWQEKPMLLMATSPGARGGASVLQTAKAGFPYLGGNIVADFSLPSFYDNFSENGIKDNELNVSFNQNITLFQNALNN